MSRTHTYTYALLALSELAYNEIKHKLKQAGYRDAISEEGELDMRGLALVKEDADQLTMNNFKKVHDRVVSTYNGCLFDGSHLDIKTARCINPKHWKFMSVQKG